MKLTLKLLLILCILIAGIYGATPWWLSYVLSGQLPTGFQLEKLQTGYPGLSGINIHQLRVHGALQAVGITLTATNIRFDYRGLKTDIDSLQLDVFLQHAEDLAPGTLALDDLSLPITRLTGRYPLLSVNRMQVVLHQGDLIALGILKGPGPLVLNFQTFKLLPRTDNSFQIMTDLDIEGVPEMDGQLDVSVSSHSLVAKIRFPATPASPPWLAVSFEQHHQPLNTTSKIQATFDSQTVNREWLDRILVQSTAGTLTHVSGNLQVQADFAGKELQSIKHLSVNTGQLQLQLADGTINLNAEVTAKRDGEKIKLALPRSAEMLFQDRAGKINTILAGIAPDLKRASLPATQARAEFAAGSSLIIQAGTNPSMEFNGAIKIGIISPESNIGLQSGELHIKTVGFNRPEPVDVKGMITLNWFENAPTAYTFDDAHSLPVTVTADEMSMTAEFGLHDGNLVSTGDSTFINARISSPATSAVKIEAMWHDLDLLKMTGDLSINTQGFTTDFEGETWTGFDFENTYTLESNTDVSGSGTVKFDAGPVLPIKFAGNVQAGLWEISLPLATIKLPQLGDLLRVADYELPASVNLTDGYIEIQGDVVVADEITAKLAISGFEIGASMQESTANMVSFSFNTSYGNAVSAIGPLSIQTFSLAGGVDVSHIRAELNLEDRNTFGLKDLYAEVFDGRLSVESLQFSDNRIEDTSIELADINLGRLLEYVDIDGLDGTGIIDILLPTGSDQTGIYINNGSFRSNGDGHLAYTKEGVAGSNIGLQALENFHYQGLSGTVNYQSDGAYQVGVRLEGKNPDLYGGHPIVFNLNISGSLPELFEALFITGSFEESILNQIRVK